MFEFADGARFVFSGSWCSPGAETSWNGTWRVNAAGGTAVWDGDNAPVPEAEVGTDVASPSPHDGIAGSLQVFVAALRTGDALR